MSKNRKILYSILALPISVAILFILVFILTFIQKVSGVSMLIAILDIIKVAGTLTFMPILTIIILIIVWTRKDIQKK